MSVNLLAISVGNSRVQLGLFVEEHLREQRSYELDDLDAVGGALKELYDQLQDATAPAVFLASVNEPVAEKVRELARQRTGQPVVRIEKDVTASIGRQLDREAIVGEDRLLAASAAYDRIQHACIVVDAGSAVTVDFVDGEGTLHGGAILPGARMMLGAMHERSAQLPQIEMARPEEPIGHNTAEAMRAGVFHGIRGAVRELVERYAEFYGAFPKVVATGGDAELLLGDYELIEVIVPELTLRGMAVARRHELQSAE